MDHHDQFDEQLVLISTVYPPAGAYPQVPLPPQQHGSETKPVRRRRRKSKGLASSCSEADCGVARKRKLSEEQVNMLELSFGREHKLESERKDKLASELGLDPRQVAVWFQNRRARFKNKKLEDEFSKLKTLHDNIVLEKCQLESQVLRLKEQLSEAEKEIRRLAERAEGNSTNSPNSSLSIEAIDAPFFGEFVPEIQYDNLFYVSESENNYAQNMEWFGLYV